MQQILSQIFKIREIGTDVSFGYIENLRIRLINDSCIIIGAFLVLINLESFFMFGWNGLWTFIIVPSIPFSCIYANYKGYSKISKYILTLVFPLLATTLWVLFGKDMGMEYTLVPFAAGVMVFYDSGKFQIINLLYLIIIYGFGFYYSHYYDSIFGAYSSIQDSIEMIVLSVALLVLTLRKFFENIKQHHIVVEENNAILQQKNEELKELNDKNNFKEKLLGMIAHDIRAPIGAFKKSSKMMNALIRKNDYQKIDKLMNYFEGSSEQLFSNLDNLLHWVLSQHDNINIQITKFELVDVVQDVIDYLEGTIELKEINIDVHISKAFCVQTDLNILKIILKNIIENAIKYSPPQTTIDIALKTNLNGNYIHIIDQGKGVDELLINELKNGNGTSTKLSNDGHGLGLQLCFYFAKLIDLKLDFKNLVGQGTEVIVEIPKENSTLKEDKKAIASH